MLLVDGETEHIKAITKELEKGELKHLDILKIPAGCSGIEQPNDVAPVFRSLKKMLSSGKHKQDADKRMVEVTKKNMLEINKKYKEQNKGKKNELSAAIMHKVVRLLQCVQPCLSQAFGYINIIQGYKESGVSPYSAEQILSKLPGINKFSSADLKHASEAVPKLTEKIRSFSLLLVTVFLSGSLSHVLQSGGLIQAYRR